MKCIEQLQKHINDFNKCPDNFKPIFLNTITNYYEGYDGIIELIPKLKSKNIDTFIKCIYDKINNKKSKQEIINFYSKHLILVNFLLDNLDIIFEEDEKIENNYFEWRENQLRGIQSSIDSNFVNGIHSQATGSGKSLMELKIMWEYHKNKLSNEKKSISINELEYFEKRIGVDVGYGNNLSHPDYPDSKKGYDKNLQLEEIIKLAKDISGNIIIKAGKNAKWYIKKINLESIDELIEKQKWRNTSRCTMYIVKFI